MTERPVTGMLRRALEERAGRVEPSPDALRVIRERIRTSGRRRFLAVGFAGLATAAAAAVTAVVLALPATAPEPGLGAPSAPATTGPVVQPTSPVGLRLPVYLVGTADARAVLYREFHAFPAVGGADALPVKIRAGLVDMIAGHHLDPDYHSAWPSDATVHMVQTGRDTITVDLDAPPAAPAAPALALQQLVYTATAVAAQQGRPELIRVHLTVGGASVGRLWGLDLPATLTRSSSVDTVAPVWLASPQEGDTVGRAFEVQVVGIVPAATATLIVWDGRGRVVRQQTVTLDADAPAQGEARVPMTLPPGTYRLAAYYVADDGTAAATDDHVVTVH